VYVMRAITAENGFRCRTANILLLCDE